jgi:hypothetical protein
MKRTRLAVTTAVTTARAVLGLLLLACSCGKSTTDPTPSEAGAWDYPSSSRFAVSLYSDQSTCAVGDSLDVRVIFYNMPDVFGAAFVIEYPHEAVGTSRILGNDAVLPAPGSCILLSRIEPDSDKVCCGFTFLRGHPQRFHGSAAVLKLRCQALQAGTAVFRFRDVPLSITGDDGAPVANLANLERDSLLVVIR